MTKVAGLEGGFAAKGAEPIAASGTDQGRFAICDTAHIATIAECWLLAHGRTSLPIGESNQWACS